MAMPTALSESTCDMNRRETNDIVEIALASDRNYFRGLAVTACSIAKHADKAASIRFHILHIGLTVEDRCWLTDRIQAFHPANEVEYHDVETVDMSDFPVYASSRMAYARLFLPHILPSVSHIIYSDVDVLWKDDISELWNCRFDIKLVACVRELSRGTLKMEREWFESRGLPFDENRYFCTGIGLYNLNEIRRRDAFAAVLEFGRAHSGFNCADQSMMYATIGQEVTFLPDKWQTFPRNGIAARRDEPIVLHYAGEAPWKASRITKMLTDTQLLWFDMCAEVFGETKWQSLRKFYKVWEIVAYRVVFLMIFRIPPLHALFRTWLRRTGRGPFEEALR